MPVIYRLSEEVINKIAAGEVVQRPSAALKELLENSLDAHADEINVIASNGGLTYLQVRDNGCGVGYDDLPLLCARHATSKLKSVDELYSITSFGFRGEALASLSYVAKVKVITRMHVTQDSSDNMCSSELPLVQSSSSCSLSLENKTQNNNHINTQVAWEAHYGNGLLTDEPIPVAGNYGTTIIAENMFYNTPVRLKSIKPTEEWNRLREVVVKYAFAFPFVGFSVQRITRSQIDPANPLGSTRNSRASQECDYLVFPKHSTTRRNLQLAFANTISSHLHLIAFTTLQESYEVHEQEERINNSSSNNDEECSLRKSRDDERSKIESNCTKESVIDDSRDECKTREEELIINAITCSGKLIQKLSFEEGAQEFALWGYISDSFVTNNRKHYLSLFVNNRLVECYAVRKMLDSLYSGVSVNNNACKYVVVLMLYLPCSRVDVNIHPTKQEVRMFDELFVVTKISEIIRETISKITSMVQPFNSALIANTNVPASIAALSSTVNLKSELSTSTHQRECGSSELTNKTNQATSIVENNDRVKNKTKNNCNNDNRQAITLNTNEFMKNTSFTLPPSCMVRIEPQKGALDRYMQTMNNKVISVTDNSSNKDSTSNEVDSKELNLRKAETIENVQTTVSALVVPEVDTTHTATHTLSMKRGREEVFEDFNDNENTVCKLELENKEHKVEQLNKTISLECKETGECESKTNMKQNNKIYTTIAATNDDDDDNDDDDALMLKEFRQFQEKACTNNKFHKNNVVTDDDDDGRNDEDFGKHINDVTSETSNTECNEEQCEQSVNTDTTIQENLTAQSTKDSFVLLTSVERIVHAIEDESSNTIQQFFANMSFVGVVNSRCFLVQVNTTLYMMCTSRIVYEAIYQRLFMQWAFSRLSLTRSPTFTLSTPLSVSDLLYHTLAFDTSASLWPPSPVLLKLIEESIQEVSSTSQNIELIKKIKQEWSECKRNNSTRLSSYVMRHLLFHVEETTDLINKSTLVRSEYDSSYDKNKVQVKEACVSENRKEQKHFSLESEQSQFQLIPTTLTRKYVQRLTKRLRHWSEMLSEYFGIVFHTFSADKLENENNNKMERKRKCMTEELYLLSLPAGQNLQWLPTLHQVPLFVWQLAERVPYPSERYDQSTLELKERLESNTRTDSIDDEVKCFRAIAKYIANTLYKIDDDEDKEEVEEHTPHTQTKEESAVTAASPSSNYKNSSNNNYKNKNMNSKSIEHILLPCVQNAQLFKPPARFLTDRTIQSIVSVETLYKIFERC